MKVVRCKSATRYIDEAEHFDSLCRDDRTDEELALEKSTLAKSRKVMAHMREVYADGQKHLAHFR